MTDPRAAGFDPNAASRPDGGIFGLKFSETNARMILLPVPWDATTSYRAGTADGWKVILSASGQIDLLDIQMRSLGVADPWRQGIHLAAPDDRIPELNRATRALAEPIIAAGGVPAGDAALAANLAAVNRASEELNEIVRTETARLIAAGKIVGLVGGDHSVSFGAIQAHAARYPGLGILQFDAHADLRHAYEGFTHSHASIMCNVLNHIPGVAALTQVGIRDLCEEELEWTRRDGRLHTFFQPALDARLYRGANWGALTDDIVATLPHDVYVSFDIDGLDPTLCPNTGTPVPGGLSFSQAAYLLGAIHTSGRRVIGFDLNEVAPAKEGDDEWDGNVGARLLYKLAALALAP